MLESAPGEKASSSYMQESENSRDFGTYVMVERNKGLVLEGPSHLPLPLKCEKWRHHWYINPQPKALSCSRDLQNYGP